jgi:hypothetical protein
VQRGVEGNCKARHSHATGHSPLEQGKSSTRGNAGDWVYLRKGERGGFPEEKASLPQYCKTRQVRTGWRRVVISTSAHSLEELGAAYGPLWPIESVLMWGWIT